MNRLRKNDPNYDASPEPTSDPTFDLRRGIIRAVGDPAQAVDDRGDRPVTPVQMIKVTVNGA